MRKNSSDLQCGLNNVPGLKAPFPGPADHARISMVNRQPLMERNQFQNHSFLPSPGPSSGPMTEFSDSELQLPMRQNIPHPSQTDRNIPQPSPMPRNSSHTSMPWNVPHRSPMPRNIPHPSQMDRNIPQPSPMPRNIPHPSQMDWNTSYASPMTLGPYQQAQMNPITSPYEQNMMQEYFRPMMHSQGQNPPSMMTIAQSPNQIMQHQMISKIPVSTGCPQDVRFSPYPQQPSPSTSSTAAYPSTSRGFGRDQTFVMHSTKANSSLPSGANKSATFKLGKASAPAKTNKNPRQANNHRFFMGTIDQVVRWYKTVKEVDLYVIYRTAGVLESMKRGKWDEYVMVLRDHQDPEEREEGGRVSAHALQLVFHPIDRDLPSNLVTGQLVTCVGRMLGENKMQVLTMEPTTKEELIGLRRISFLCQWALQEAANKQ